MTTEYDYALLWCKLGRWLPPLSHCAGPRDIASATRSPLRRPIDTAPADSFELYVLRGLASKRLRPLTIDRSRSTPCHLIGFLVLSPGPTLLSCRLYRQCLTTSPTVMMFESHNRDRSLESDFDIEPFGRLLCSRSCRVLAPMISRKIRNRYPNDVIGLCTL